MPHRHLRMFFLNVGHFLDHFFVLIFATVAALKLNSEWGMSYAALIPYATPGFIAFGVCAIPAGWLADKWNREGMMVIFFVGIGISSVLASLANTPLQIAITLSCMGVFAAIYHPVGLAMVVHGRDKTGMPLAINGVFGNMGVACAALTTGYFIDTTGWRSAYIVPGVVAILLGVLYLLFIRNTRHNSQGSSNARATSTATNKNTAPPPVSKTVLIRIFSIIFFTTAIGGLIFQSTTFALPKVFDERIAALAGSATLVGWYAFLVFSVAALAQLVVGYLVDKYPVRYVFACIALLQSVFFIIMIGLNGIAALIVAMGFMLVVFGQIPINDVLVGRIARSEWRSRAYALRYVITFSVMASAVPVIAWVHSQWGFDALFGLLATAASCIFLAVLFLPAIESK